MNVLILNLIMILHILIIGFVIITPFIGSNYFLLCHAILVPFMIFHWMINDNTCALTIIEKNIRLRLYGRVQDSDCISYRLMAPIYDFNKNHDNRSDLTYFITFGLWLISVSKLYYRYKNGNISNFKDLLFN